ncbi:MAG: 16S rRNA (adenine(1518)-N(6)/adenine(1519)-N(6))-dimethyltransferase RsmA, partial [Candidatus Peregrinibacteria bacterium]|nr:16S rRNA (adenine(1518)-N(6)/adenine(1519)-N(6))-dimethyltransferase RsmA [Candidatus Peregrinibacteria bacterium]
MQKQFAKKSLGQNFLNSTEIRDGILEAAGDLKDKNILEIGPGLGFLTEKLLEAGANLTAVEKDDRAYKILTNEFPENKKFHLINGDFLEQNLDELFEQKKYSAVANIPYNITNPILRKLLCDTKNKPEFSILMVQKEVAQKICPVIEGKAKKKNKRSILSISVEVFAEAELLFLVDRENFTPVPRVDSAIMYIKTREKPLIDPELEKDFFTVVNAGFSRKRKKIGNVLPGY